MLGLFVFPAVIHITLTWTTGSLTCVSLWSFLCVCTQAGGLGTPTANQNNIFWLGKTLIKCSCALLTGFEPRVFGSSVLDALPMEPLPSPRRPMSVTAERLNHSMFYISLFENRRLSKKQLYFQQQSPPLAIIKNKRLPCGNLYSLP